MIVVDISSYPEGFGGELNKKHHRRLLSRLFPRKASLTTPPSPAADSATGVCVCVCLSACVLKIVFTAVLLTFLETVDLGVTSVCVCVCVCL